MTALVGPPSPTATRWPSHNTGLRILQLVLTALFAFVGVNMLFGLQQEMFGNFTRPGLGDWPRYFAAAVELAGEIRPVIPGLVAHAALWLAGVVVGAVVTQFVV